MKIYSDILINDSVKGDRDKLAEKAIIQNFVKQLLNSNILDVKKRENESGDIGTTRYYCDFLIFTGGEANHVVKMLNKQRR